MRVELTSEIFATSAHLQDVTALLRLFSQGRHDWTLPPGMLDVAAGYLELHLSGLAQVYKELAQEAATQLAYNTAGSSTQVVVSIESISDHVADLEKPAVLVVENDSADKGFVVAIMRVFDAPDLLIAIDRGWLVVDHGGGSSIYRLAEETHQGYRRLVRTAALLDSDRLQPNTPAKNADRIEEVRKAGVLVHVLELREAENYLPNLLLNAHRPYREMHPKLTLLKSFTPDQRGYFDMKKGFHNGVPAEQSQLFAGVHPRVISGLTSGFGGNVIELFKIDGPTLTENDFAKLGPNVQDELKSVVAMLRKIL